MLPVVRIGTKWVGVGKTNLTDAPRTSVDVRVNMQCLERRQRSHNGEDEVGVVIV